MLFKPKHIPMIKDETKTETRRRISRFKKGPKTGKVVPPKKIDSIQPCKTTLFGATECYIKIIDRYVERLGDITSLSAKYEGNYTKEEYIHGLIEMYDNQIDENEPLWVYIIKYVGDERPEENDTVREKKTIPRLDSPFPLSKSGKEDE